MATHEFPWAFDDAKDFVADKFEADCRRWTLDDRLDPCFDVKDFFADKVDEICSVRVLFGMELLLNAAALHLPQSSLLFVKLLRRTLCLNPMYGIALPTRWPDGGCSDQGTRH